MNTQKYFLSEVKVKIVIKINKRFKVIRLVGRKGFLFLKLYLSGTRRV